jgi:hypothetical protein
MRKNGTMHDLAKIATGLILGDIFAIIWFLASDLLPLEVWGFVLTTELAYLGLAFDIFLFIMLVHYAWHPKALEPTVTMRGLFMLIGIITTIIAVVHAARLIFGWEFVIGTWITPPWISWVAVIITAYIAYASFHLMGRKNK